MNTNTVRSIVKTNTDTRDTH